MTTIAAVKAAFANLSTKIKAFVIARDQVIIDDVDNIVSDLTDEINEQIAAMGQDSGDGVAAVYERYVALGAGSVIDCWQANHFGKTITAATTFSLTNVPSAGKVYTIVLRLVNAGAFATNFWANISWNEGTKPTFTASGRDIVAFTTVDGGATWDGFLLSKAARLPA